MTFLGCGFPSSRHFSLRDKQSKEAGKLTSQQCWEQEISPGYHMEVVQKAKMLLHNYVLCMYSDTNKGFYNGPNLPSLRSDALKLCSLCQPGFLQPSRGVICREWMRLLISFHTHKNDARGRMELDEYYHKYQCLCWILVCSFFLAGNPFPACLVICAAWQECFVGACWDSQLCAP